MLSPENQAVLENIADNNAELSSCLEKRASHIRDAACGVSFCNAGKTDVLREIFASEGGVSSYSFTPDNTFDISEVNHAILPHVQAAADDFDKMNFCRFITREHPYSAQEIDELLFGTMTDTAPSARKKVGLVRNKQSGAAFVLFASEIHGLDAAYEEDFRGLCESVSNNAYEFAVIPLWNSTDGRIDSLYKLVFRYSLVIRMVAKVESEEGETTHFALVGKNSRSDLPEAPDCFEFNIAFADCSQIGEVITAIRYFGSRVISLASLPESSGQKNGFGFIMDVTHADLTGFLAYIGLYFPRFVPVGIYRIAGQGGLS